MTDSVSALSTTETLDLAAELADSPPGLAVLVKTGPTPAGFPRRPGVARKRPLG